MSGARRRWPLQSTVGLGLVATAWALALVLPVVLSSGSLQHYDHVLEPPSWAYPLGTDNLGRSVLARTAEGARLSLVACAIAVILAAAIGVPLGVVSGFYSGKVVDRVIGRMGDTLLALPALVLALTLAVALGPGIHNVVISVVAIYSPQFMRVARGQTIAIRRLPYFDSGRMAGGSDMYLMARYVVPNIAGPLIAFFALSASATLLIEAGLSYLGVSAQPPTASLGAMVREGQGYMAEAPWMSVFPGAVVLLVCVGYNLIGDGLTAGTSGRTAPRRSTGVAP